MKLLASSRPAPRNADPVTYSTSDQAFHDWFGRIGSVYTSSGVRVNEDVALTYSAVWCATRIISETIAVLPKSLKEQEDERTTRTMFDHPLHKLIADQPNPEQDAFTFFDCMVPWQVNWGNAYAEIQRRASGEIVNLWPIHPSRIPLRNITRNPSDYTLYHQIEVGQPGEIVYWVNNEDGTKTPIRARDMLHVPGVLSQNGITGQGIIKWGAQSIGIALATDRHAGAFFRNGAASNMAIKSPKIVGKETADRLRNQWQETFGGVSNHYKTLLLEDGMEPVPIQLDAQESQLIDARKFGPSEIARWYRLPPHMLADLSRSSFSNIEAENISFVIHAAQPWAVRWEKALKRQTLSEPEKAKLFFFFNLVGLMRGDSKSRMNYWKNRFAMGSASPNDVRAAEGDNPVAGGDVYLVPVNNLAPLEQVGQPQPGPGKGKKNGRAPQPVPGSGSDQDNGGQGQGADGESPDNPPVAPPPAAPKNPEPPDDRAALTGQGTAAPLPELKHTIELAQDLARREFALETNQAALRSALRDTLAGVLEGFSALETRALLRAAEKPGQFPSWRETFYPDLGVKIEDALKRFQDAALYLGTRFEPADVSARYCAQSRTALEALDSVPVNSLKPELEKLLASWADPQPRGPGLSGLSRVRAFVCELFEKSNHESRELHE